MAAPPEGVAQRIYKACWLQELSTHYVSEYVVEYTFTSYITLENNLPQLSSHMYLGKSNEEKYYKAIA